MRWKFDLFVRSGRHVRGTLGGGSYRCERSVSAHNPRAQIHWALCFIAFLAADGAEAAKWQEAARGKSGTLYLVDTESVRREGQVASASVRVDYPQMQFTAAGEGYTTAVNVYRINCSAREIGVVESRLYAGADRLVTTQRSARMEWEKVEAGTVSDAMASFICDSRQAQAAPAPSAATPSARNRGGMTSISKDEDDEWLVADETVSVTGSKFIAVAFQEYVKSIPDKVSGKQVKTIGWRVEGDCSRSQFRITLKRAFDANVDLVREFELSAEDTAMRQPASDTVAFAIMEHVCASKGFKVSGATPAPSNRGNQRPATSQAPPPARSERASGSAFAVSPVGHLLTNNHVVKGCEQVWVSAPGVPRSSGQVMVRDDRNDLAIVKAPLKTAAFATFRTTPVRAGESVVALGYPLKGLLANEVNVSTGTVSALAGLQNDTTKIQISAPIQPGNSGGPVLDSTGAIAAVVVEKLDALAVARVTGALPENISFGIRSEIATVFMRSAGIEPSMSPQGGAQLTAPDIAQRGKPFTYLLECEAGR